tara:strand:+ start:803 stop:1483 length:681 start_codon:yes stop_codon:yes gene_type:complete
MNNELKKRLLTSIFLSVFLISAFFYTFILIIVLIIIFLLSWIEFNGLIKRIISKVDYFSRIKRLLISAITLIYLFYFSVIVFITMQQLQTYNKLNLLFLLLICICSDVGGFIFGKTFKGKKLTKISPNKTISGSLGSFILPLILVPIFFYLFLEKFDIFQLLTLTILVSLICQLGDLFISFLKRKANVKDTGDLLPGHGGILDRIDGIIFALPFGLILWEFLIVMI